MAHILALDWDHRELHLVAADINRGRVRIERAISWIEEAPLTADNAEDFGKRLRDRLKTANIAPGPLLVGLGRDRFVAKEVRFPQVAPDIEVTLVRNQIVKDLTDPADEVLLDYCPLKAPGRGGERRALSVVGRKDMVLNIQNACKVAGLKLSSITARPFGVVSAVNKLAGSVPQIPAPPSPDAVVGVLTATAQWAEFSAVRGDQLLFARPVAVGDTLLGEVRRNLAAYAGQPHLTFPRDALQALYVAGNGENAVLREKLLETLGIPVYGLDPFAGADRIDAPADSRAGFIGAVGLLHLWAVDGTTPINLVKPREAKPPANPTRRRFVVYGVLGAAAAGLLLFFVWRLLGEKEGEIARLRGEYSLRQRELKDLQPEIKYLEALSDWRVEPALPWLDELYDLAARAPYDKDFRVTQITITPLAAKSAKEKAKDKDKVNYTARMMIEGKVTREKEYLVSQLVKKINDDSHCKAILFAIKSDGNPTDQNKKNEVFTVQVDIAHQAQSEYRIVLTPPPNSRPVEAKEPPDAVEPVEPDPDKPPDVVPDGK